MKRKFLFTLLLLAAAFCSPARAMDVYVYINGSYVPVNVSENIYKIVFEDEYTHFITASGETATLRNEAFSFLTFRKLETPVGINAAKAEAVTITYENEGIRVKSASVPANVRIIDTAGNVMADITPRNADMFFSLCGMPAGVYIVTAGGGKNVTIKKITKNK